MLRIPAFAHKFRYVGTSAQSTRRLNVIRSPPRCRTLAFDPLASRRAARRPRRMRPRPPPPPRKRPGSATTSAAADDPAGTAPVGLRRIGVPARPSPPVAQGPIDLDRKGPRAANPPARHLGGVTLGHGRGTSPARSSRFPSAPAKSSFILKDDRVGTVPWRWRESGS